MKIRIIAAIIIIASSYNSCLKDDLVPADYFAGPSEFTIEFQSGSFTGKTYNLVSNTPYHDHEFIVASSIQKVLSKPLQDNIQQNLNAASFVNWAWQGDTISGQFTAVFATDPSIAKSGDLQLIFTNGDELISSIPKGTLIEIDSYGGPEGAIIGNLSFTSQLDYRISGSSNKETASLYVSFKIKRGPNL